MIKPLDPVLKSAYTQVSKSDRRFWYGAFALMGVGAGLLILVLMMGPEITSTKITFGFLCALSLMGALLCMFAGEIWGTAKLGEFLRSLSDEQLQELLLSPVEEGIWVPGVQQERARRQKLTQTPIQSNP